MSVVKRFGLLDDASVVRLHRFDPLLFGIDPTLVDRLVLKRLEVAVKGVRFLHFL